ncbi:MAG: 4-alpha-glucanotransferase [Verrucomicrobiae bacterium]|nr:4-alpha-glucanotransferase [Verrucomicrobiae bacterium]
MSIDPTKKLSGLLTPVFALRSQNDLGIGDTEAVCQMIDWCAAHRFDVLQVLPINETGDDNSPYNAISSMAIDPTTITLSPKWLPDLPSDALARLVPPDLLEELRRGPVKYRKVKPLKMALLREACACFIREHWMKETPRAAAFRAFLTENQDWVADYALFRTLMTRHGNLPVWEDWPVEHQTSSRARSWVMALPESERRQVEDSQFFFAYAQWIAREQWVAVKKHAGERKVFLMGDIPYGVGRYSADVWGQRAFFDLRWSCGAPPETFFKPDVFTEKWGQNWGIPLYRWDWMREDGCSWWRSRVRGAAAAFHYFRIDHVLGFYRIYAFPWKPQDNWIYTELSKDQAKARTGGYLPRFWLRDDDTPEHKKSNCIHGEELLRMVLNAAGDTGVVAEDLGMVPDYVRPSLLQMGIPGFKIPIFEREKDGSYRNSEKYAPLSVATLGTHDHEPVAALWKRWSDPKCQEGAKEKQHLLQWADWKAGQASSELDPALHAAICGKLFASSSWLAVLMITDLFAETTRFNVPGPMSDSNWAERLPLAVTDFDSDPTYRARVQAVEKFLPRTPATGR